MFPVGTVLLDSASSIDPVQAYQSGSRAQFRYSAGAGNTAPAAQFKLCKPGEYAQIIASGQKFLANSEWYETRCTEGHAAGLEDGQADLSFWKSRGLPQGETIYVSWDAAPDPALYDAVQQYYAGYQQGLGTYYAADGGYMGIPALVEMSRRGVIKHGWIPEGPAWSVPDEQLPAGFAPPANTSWDLWNPLPNQIQPAVQYLTGKLAGHKLVSCVWQDRNKWFNNAADENLVIIAGPLSSRDVPAPAPAPHPAPAPAPHPAPAPAPHVTTPKPVWPLPSGHYLGLASGPVESHSGDPQYDGLERQNGLNPDAIRAAIRYAQNRMIDLGYAGTSNRGWADGLYEQPTVNAVAAWQHAHWAAQTSLFGQVWSDDYSRL